jgi:hypothetical protein
MAHTEGRPARIACDELAVREPGTRRAVVARRRRRQMRLRRSVVLMMTLLLCGTAAARWAEDPRDVFATGVVRELGQAGRDSGAEAPPPEAVAGPSSTAASARSAGGTPAATPVGSAAPGGAAPGGAAPGGAAPGGAAPGGAAPGGAAPGGAAPGAAAPGGAAPHADDDSEASRDSLTRQTDPAKQVVTAGNGALTAVAVPDGPLKASGRAVRYSLEVEGGIPVNPAEVAEAIRSVLTDDRGWQTTDGIRFVPVGPGEVASGADIDIRITLASPALTAKLCAPLNVTAQQVSCWNGGRSVLNLTRWMLGSETYGGDLAAYQVYLVNHEVGHGLGHQHVSCPAPGQRAPVMVQQTKSLEGCVAWPFPTAP